MLRKLNARFQIAGDERGLSTVEYVIILVLVAVAAIGTWKAFGETVTRKVGQQGAEIEKMQ
ncbi:MAG: hypothetical protein SFV15_04900 [Polyangiaceae bacterium]|nr:hypothetical protein [Polyangiaceae bacterium]